MPTLPANPNLDQLRHQAKDLLRAAQTGDADALSELRRVSEQDTLDAAQLAIARRYGFASWAKLKTGVEARNVELAEHAIAFCQASVNRIGVAARMLETTPELAEYSFATAVVLGDAARVAEDLRCDPSLASRTDPRWGWSPLHLACASRWCQLDSARADGLLGVAKLLLDAGVDPTATTSGRRGEWTPLRCVIASANSGPSNRPLAELLLKRGTVPNDHDLYLAGFAHDRHQLLPMLIAKTPNLAEVAEQALAAPISNNDTESARMLLAAGADPNQYKDDDGQPVSVVWAALEAGCGHELVELLLDYRADPNAAGPNGRTPDQVATAGGQTELAELLRRYGAADSATSSDRFLSACRRADRADAEQLLNDDPSLLERLSDEERAAIFRAAEQGETAAVGLMLNLGFPLETRGDDGGTALHAAAYNGSTQTVRLLLDRGADIEARDSTWHDTPLGWAAVGSGERPRTNNAADWIETTRTLLGHGASTKEISLDPDNAKPPSPEVAELLRAHLDRLPPR